MLCKICNQEKDISQYRKWYCKKADKYYYRKECNQCKAKIDKKYYDDNKKDILKRVSEYKKNHRELYNKLNREYRKRNPDKIKAYTENIKIRRRPYIRKWIVNKLNKDVGFRILHNLRRRINHVLHDRNKSKSTMELLGCSIEYFKEYIESKFEEGMTWENYGKWHIDHIMPCSYFDFVHGEQQELCFHFTNLQPLWAIDNLKKGNKVGS